MNNLQEVDILRCMSIVKDELEKNKVQVKENVLRDITIDIMNISYSKGGDYSNNTIKDFAETYIENELYDEFLK